MRLPDRQDKDAGGVDLGNWPSFSRSAITGASRLVQVSACQVPTASDRIPPSERRTSAALGASGRSAEVRPRRCVHHDGLRVGGCVFGG